MLVYSLPDVLRPLLRVQICILFSSQAFSEGSTAWQRWSGYLPTFHSSLFHVALRGWGEKNGFDVSHSDGKFHSREERGREGPPPRFL